MVCKESLLGYTAGRFVWIRRLAMVCKESLLGYTGVTFVTGNTGAMVCKESLLGYTSAIVHPFLCSLWFARSRCSDILTNNFEIFDLVAMVCKESLLGYTAK